MYRLAGQPQEGKITIRNRMTSWVKLHICSKVPCHSPHLPLSFCPMLLARLIELLRSFWGQESPIFSSCCHLNKPLSFSYALVSWVWLSLWQEAKTWVQFLNHMALYVIPMRLGAMEIHTYIVIKVLFCLVMSNKSICLTNLCQYPGMCYWLTHLFVW